MSIPESRLLTWTNQGSVTNSALTHNVLRNALARHSWPSVMSYADYLQGSYANTTNIRGESDVDIVIECTSLFHHSDLTYSDEQILGLQPGKHNFEEFRSEVISALVSFYGDSYVDTSGANSIKVLPSDTTNRLYADVIVCCNYKYYHERRIVAEGITFWNRKTYNQIVNYPKLHKANGATKNSNTLGKYKQTVRMFKNARRYMIEGDVTLKKKFSSYFVESLLYNVPNNHFFNSTWQQVFQNILIYLIEAFGNDAVDEFTTQSGMHYLIGNHPVQWAKPDAQEFVTRLSDLWENYYG
jgi:hypothetical protein